VDECYSKHAFPPWYKQKGEQSSTNNDKVCNQILGNDSIQDQVDKQEQNPFNADQIQKLLQLLETSNSSNHINQIQRYNDPETQSKGKTS